MTAKNIFWSDSAVQKQTRERLLDQKGCVIWLTGLSGSGKTTLARALEAALTERQKLVYVLDGDNVRHGLNRDLGFSSADREENVRRVGEVAGLFCDAGLITIVAFISPYRKDRQFARSCIPAGKFVEVFIDAPLTICEKRDPKGLYGRVRAGEIQNFTGIDAPYEAPEDPEIVLDTGACDVPRNTARLLELLNSQGMLNGSIDPSLES